MGIRTDTSSEFRQDGKDFVGIRYHLRKLPPRFLFHWIGPLSEPYLIFDSKGLCVDKSDNYNDDHLFVHRWPALWKTYPSIDVKQSVK